MTDTQETQNAKGIGLMIAAMLVFASQDGVSRYLAGEYNVIMVVMIRYWFFAAFVLALTTRQPGGIRATAATPQLRLQLGRGALLALEICVMVYAFTLLGLVTSLAIFMVNPLLVAALSGPILGEKVGWRRWAAVGVGFVGLLIILKPGLGVFDPNAIIAFAASLMFALYTMLTRYASRRDRAATSFFWTGVTGAIVMTIIGPFFWEPMAPHDWGWMALLCVLGASGHWLLIKTYDIAEASAVQPFAYLQLAFASMIGITVFGEVLQLNVAFGTALIVAAGLFTLFRERARRRRG